MSACSGIAKIVPAFFMPSFQDSRRAFVLSTHSGVLKGRHKIICIEALRLCVFCSFFALKKACTLLEQSGLELQLQFWQCLRLNITRGMYGSS